MQFLHRLFDRHHRFLGNLPPLTGARPLGLAPLKKTLEPLGKPEQDKAGDQRPEQDKAWDRRPEQDKAGDRAFSKSSDRKNVPKLGFERDYVISDGESLSAALDKVG